MADDGEKRVDLVFEGGGVKGIALVGACSILEEQGYRPQNVAGTSAGAIVGALVVAGYSAKELRDLLQETPFSSFEDKGWEDKILGLGIPITIVKDHGIYEGKYFSSGFVRSWKEKGVSRFVICVRRARTIRGGGTACRSSCPTSPTTRSSCFPRRPGLGKEPDELEIAEAVRMSMSIPLFFEPVKVERLATRSSSSTAACCRTSRCGSSTPTTFPTGRRSPQVVNPEPKVTTDGQIPTAPVKHTLARGLVQHLLDLAGTMTDAHDKLYLERDSFVRTITISNLGVSYREFDLSVETQDALYESGRDAATEFLKTWDFEAAKAAFRRGRSSRRAVRRSLLRMKTMAAG